MTIGGTMHSVQDFYTHSNWVDFYYRTQCDCYRSETWIALLHQFNGDLNAMLDELSSIHTYSYGNCDEDSRNCLAGQLPHGDSCGGINKDSYVRPYWEPSYAFAFSASVEWLDNIHRWTNEVDGTMIDRAKSYVPPSQQDIDDLNQLDDYVHTVSYAIKFRENDGHWKGPGSGSLKRFLPATLEFTASKNIYKQKWTSPNVYDAADLDSAQQVDLTSITAITTPYSGASQFTPIVVRTVAVRGSDSRNTPSYFSTVNIDGMEFVETVQIDFASFLPYWTTVKFVNATSGTFPIEYTLKNNKYPSGDEVVSITPSGSQSLSLQYDIASHSLSGDINGVYDSISNTFTTSNPSAGVEVQMFVTSYRFATCTSGLPEQYCPNEAYVYVGAFGECEGETIAEGAASSLSYSLPLFIVAILFIYAF